MLSIAPSSVIGRQPVDLFNFPELVGNGERGEEAVDRPGGEENLLIFLNPNQGDDVEVEGTLVNMMPDLKFLFFLK